MNQHLSNVYHHQYKIIKNREKTSLGQCKANFLYECDKKQKEFFLCDNQGDNVPHYGNLFYIS